MRLTRTLLSIAGAASLALCSPAFAQARDPEAILRELNSMQAPQYDAARRGDQEYRERYSRESQEYMTRRAALARELFEADPAHAETPTLMRERWSTLARAGAYDEVLAETQSLADGDSPLALAAAFTYAEAYCQKHEWNMEECARVIDAAIARDRKDERGAVLLSTAARNTLDAETQLTLYRRLLAEYPDSRATKYAGGKIKQLERVGEPFELSFQNAVDGETIDVGAAEGTIFVIDFWATWCGPCVAEMPHMKELYAEFKGQGVEFIGVSLDNPESQGGLQKLLAYVETNEIAWPQYYQGGGWDSEFSKSWGINSIPCLFVVDHEGNLFSTNARGKLEEILPMLIERRRAEQ